MSTLVPQQSSHRETGLHSACTRYVPWCGLARCPSVCRPSLSRYRIGRIHVRQTSICSFQCYASPPLVTWPGVSVHERHARPCTTEARDRLNHLLQYRQWYSRLTSSTTSVFRRGKCCVERINSLDARFLPHFLQLIVSCRSFHHDLLRLVESHCLLLKKLTFLSV